MKRMLAAVMAVVMLISCRALAMGDSVSFVLLCDSRHGSFCNTVRDAFEKASQEMGFELVTAVPEAGQTVQGLLAHYTNTDADAVFIAEEEYADVYPFHIYNDVLNIDTGTWHNSDCRYETRIDAFDAGVLAGKIVEEMARQTGGQGEIAVIAELDPEDVIQEKLIYEIEEAVREGNYPGMKLADTQWISSAYENYTGAYMAVQRLISRNPEMKGIIAVTPTDLEGAAMCINDYGLAGKIGLTGIGRPSVMVECIRSGVCEGMYIMDAAWLAHCMACVSASAVSGERCLIMDEYASEGDSGAYGGHVYEKVYTGNAIYVDSSNIGEWKTGY